MKSLWGHIKAQELVLPLKGTFESGDPHTIVTGLSTDSRQINQGEVFFAIKGENYDGHDFVNDALAEGASGAVIEEGWLSKTQLPQDTFIISVEDSLKALGDLAAWWRKQHNIQVLAITGSTGKTTTKEMIAGIFELSKKTLKSEGNFNNLIGLPLSILKIQQKHEIAVLEMGMNRPGEIARLTEIADPDIGLITNVGMAHLEGFDNFDGVVNAKVEMIGKISSGAKAIINGDNHPLVKKAALFNRKMITFGMGKNNDIRAEEIENFGINGLSFRLRYHDASWPVNLKVPGVQNVYNALAASAASLCFDELPEKIIEGLERYKGLNGRFSINHIPNEGILINDSYNSNPSSLEAALQSASEMVQGKSKIIAGIGEMMELGKETVSEHQKAGKRAARAGVHRLLVMGDHSEEVIKGAIAAGMSPNKAEIVNSHGEMIKKIKSEVGKGDIVLIKASRKMAFEKVVDGLLMQ